MTDSKRGTGRTTRMLEEVTKVSQEESVTVVAADHAQALQFKKILSGMNANMDNIHLAAISDTPYNRTPHSRTIYYDHFALELLND